jgi:hypothetical protein
VSLFPLAPTILLHGKKRIIRAEPDLNKKNQLISFVVADATNPIPHFDSHFTVRFFPHRPNRIQVASLMRLDFSLLVA